MSLQALVLPLLVVVFFLWVWDAPRNDNRYRTAIAVVSLLAGVLYLGWRAVATVFIPVPGTLIQHTWVVLVWCIEVFGFFEIMTFMLIMSRSNSRSAQADALALQPVENPPSVDIFIPTYNEPLDVLEKTIIGAMHVDYPNKTVWVLDDGRRDWLRQFCEQHGARYLIRPDNAHAKAGNINHGLLHATGEFICIFDADFVPFRQFISRTIGFFRDPTIGIVQTPQHFYNKDPIQINLEIPDDFPDEQRLFFDEMAASRDAWDASFCCGSCSIMRRQALDAIGGIPTDSITEDLLTTLVMLRKNYRTIYLNERLSIGLAAESIEGFFVQRERWGRGAVQTLFLPSGPLGQGLTFIQRLLFFPSSWLIQYPVRLMLVVIPIVYLLGGLMPLYYTSFDELVKFQGTVFLAYFLTMRWLVRGKYLPILSVAAGVFSSFRMMPSLLASLIKPFGKPFQVTPKGSDSKGGKSVDIFTFVSIQLALAATVIGLLINVIPEWSRVPFDNFYPIAVFWGILNIVILFIASLICFEGPRFRTEERFAIHEPVEVRVGSDYRIGRLLESSVSGCRIRLDDSDYVVLYDDVAVKVPDIGWIELDVMRANRGALGASFRFSEGQRDQMISKLFSGRYNNAVAEVTSARAIIKRLWHRAFS